MNRQPTQNPIVNKSTVWTISLVSASLFVPWILAQSLPERSAHSSASPGHGAVSRSPSRPIEASQSVSSSPQPSPQESSLEILPPSDNQLTPEEDWHQNLVSRSLLWQYNPVTTPVKRMGNNKQNTPPQGSIPKQQTLQAKASVSNAKTQTQTTKASPTSKQQSQNTSKQTNKVQTTKQHKAQPSSQSDRTPVIEMRVAIANGVNSLAVATSTPGEILDAKGKLLDKLSPNQAIEVLPSGPNIRVSKWMTPGGVWIKPTQGGLVFVNNRWYRGDVLLVSQGNNLLAVNYVDLEVYIGSVVGSEVYPDWPMDALKAQAIAARSYAIVHYIRPANALYDLGNTQRWQVYKGVETEWNTTVQSAQETRGIFLSYKGGVFESLYANSDDIVANVFGGNGMSQNGAYKLATQGYDYKQILNKYYPGTSLAWLDTSASDLN